MAESCQAPVVPTLSFDDTEIVTLLVGSQEHKLVVHESCITRNSEFFKAAMKKEWAEGQTRIIKLPEESCLETLSHYLNFCYGQKLPTEGITTLTKAGLHIEAYSVLVRLYVLGERLLDKAVKNSAIKEIIRLSLLKSGPTCWYPTWANTNFIYEGTTAGSPARRLMVDLHVTYGNANFVGNSSNQEFLLDLSKALLGKVSAPLQAC